MSVFMGLLHDGHDSRFIFDHDSLEFRRLGEECDLSCFSCGNRYLDEFLMDDAMASQTYNVSATTLAYWHESIVGYFTLVNDCIVTDMLEKDDRKEGYHYRKYPALKIARFATHRSYKSMGVGSAMLTDIYIKVFGISAHSGCRFITVDSKRESAGFYVKNGFKHAFSMPNSETLPMYLDFYKLSKMLGFI